MQRKYLYIIIGVVIVIIAAVGIANFTADKEKVSTEKTEYREVNRIALNMNYVKTLNPVISTDRDTYYISKLIYDGLFAQDENMTPQENLAKSYEFDRSSRSIRIDLVKTEWHDGEEFTAADVVFSISAHQSMGSAGQYSYLTDKISYARSDGDHRVIVYFDTSDDMTLNALTFPILPEHRYYGTYDLRSKVTSFRPVGTGPYRFKSYSEGNALKLKPNKDYHGNVATNQITCDIQPLNNKVYDKVGTSTVSCYISRDENRERKIARSNVEIVDFPGNQVEFLGFNFEKEYLQSKPVRKAVAAAINNEKIINSCYGSSGMLNDNIYYPNYYGVESKGDAYPYSEKSAGGYLQKAGYEDDDKDGNVEDIEGKELSLTMLIDGSNEERVRTAEIMEKNLENVGINITVTAAASNESYLKALKGKKWDLFLGGYRLDENIEIGDLLSSTSEDNYTGFENNRIDRLVDRMNNGKSVEEAEELFTKLKDALVDEIPYYCVLYKTFGAIKAPALKGNPEPNFANYYRSCNNWKCRYELSDFS